MMKQVENLIFSTLISEGGVTLMLSIPSWMSLNLTKKTPRNCYLDSNDPCEVVTDRNSTVVIKKQDYRAKQPLRVTHVLFNGV